jgi:hypothetical protein
MIDFDRIYQELFEPALTRAGCDVKRADQNVEAGDIRRDMFSMLLTADFVIADLTIPNPNVFYELGIREGACPRGLIAVRGDDNARLPFDVAPDRAFPYDPSFFFKEGANTSLQGKGDQLERLTGVFERAIAADPGAIASPVYSLLPYLRPVEWEDIKIFGKWASDWLTLVNKAMMAGRPGDILTLSTYPPPRVPSSKTQFQAAMALLGLCRYEAARTVLEPLAQSVSSDLEAQMQYATVLIRLRRIPEAQDVLNGIVRANPTAAKAIDLLGQANRFLWHLSWNSKPVLERRKAATELQPAVLVPDNARGDRVRQRAIRRCAEEDQGCVLARGADDVSVAFVSGQIGTGPRTAARIRQPAAIHR